MAESSPVTATITSEDSKEKKISVTLSFEFDKSMDVSEIIQKLGQVGKIKKFYVVQICTVYKHIKTENIKLLKTLSDVVVEFEDHSHIIQVSNNKVSGFPEVDYDSPYGYEDIDEEASVDVSELDVIDCQSLVNLLRLAYPKAKFVIIPNDYTRAD